MFNTSKGKNGKTYLRSRCRDCENKKRRKTPMIHKDKTIDKTSFTDKEILEVVLNKDTRIHTVFNLDKSVRDNLKKLANDKKLNMSDIANLIFKKFFQN